MGAKTLPLEPDPADLRRGLERLRLGAVPRRRTRRRRSCRRSPASRCALQFMRWDEHGWDNYGPAQMTDIRAGIDGERQPHRVRVHALRHPVLDDADRRSSRCTGNGRSSRRAGRAETTISGAQYSIPNRQRGREEPAAAEQLLQGDVPAGAEQPAVGVRRRAGCRRARVHGEDGPGRVPAPERREPDATIRRSGGRTCSRTWPRTSNWQPKVAASNLSSANVVTGRGVAFGFYSNTMTCCVADIEVNK